MREGFQVHRFLHSTEKKEMHSYQSDKIISESNSKENEGLWANWQVVQNNYHQQTREDDK